MSRLTRLILACLAGALVVGGLATAFVALRPATLPKAPSMELLGAMVAVMLLMVANLFIRFARWQFVLRRLGQRIPAVESLAAFMGSFAFLPVPLLVGQLAARRRLLPGAFRTSARVNVLSFVWERLLDVWALAVLASILLPTAIGWVGLTIAFAGLVPSIRRKALQLVLNVIAGTWNLLVPEPLAFDAERIDVVSSGPVLWVGASSSLLAWAVVCAGLGLLGIVADVGVSSIGLVGAASGSVLIGGLSLLPMGVAVSGLVLIDHFEALGSSDETALGLIFMYRMATAWFTLALGWIAVVLGRRHARRLVSAATHFDEIEDCYDTWLPPHYRDYMVEKKVGQMSAHLADLETARGLDIGCGRGWYLEGVKRAGCQVVGMDLSSAQLTEARDYTGGEVPLSLGSINALPFRSSSFDFAYTINVVHHLPSRDHQRRAFAEAARVLEPGGLLFLHEMNIRNPIFRGYLSYVFPILKGIDEGVEHFLDPRRLPLPPELEIVSVDFFTFVPDLCPAALLPLFIAVERRLERSRLAPLGVHFLAVLRKREDMG